MIKNKDEYITSKDAAKILGFSHDYIRKLLAAKKMRGEKLGRNWIVKVSELKKVKRKRFPLSNEGGTNGISDK